MALDDLVGETGVGNSQNYTPGLHGGLGGILQPIRDHGAWLGDGIGSDNGIMHTGILGPQLPHLRRVPAPDYGNYIGLPPTLGIAQPDYSSQFENFGETLGGFGEQLTGFGDQMTGYQDALGSFNEQMGGLGKQFETVNNKLDSVEKGIGSLGNQIASFENMQKAQPQAVQPQRPAYSPFGFGGLGSLFMRRY